MSFWWSWSWKIWMWSNFVDYRHDVDLGAKVKYNKLTIVYRKFRIRCVKMWKFTVLKITLIRAMCNGVLRRKHIYSTVLQTYPYQRLCWQIWAVNAKYIFVYSDIIIWALCWMLRPVCITGHHQIYILQLKASTFIMIYLCYWQYCSTKKWKTCCHFHAKDLELKDFVWFTVVDRYIFSMVDWIQQSHVWCQWDNAYRSSLSYGRTPASLFWRDPCCHSNATFALCIVVVASTGFIVQQ